MTNEPDVSDSAPDRLALRSPGRAEAPHRGQWMVYVGLELQSICPQIPVDAALRIADQLRGLASCVWPEYAAAAMAIGMRAAVLH